MAEQSGPFQLQDDRPALERPRLLLCLRPWVDVGAVSTMALTFLEEAWGSRRLAQLARPGAFYDFTRYRPTLHRREGQRIVTVPNTFLNHARSPDGQDWLFLHALEPHSHGDDYAEAVLQLMERLGVAEYAMVGAMYAPVPHTRPPVASGGASDDAMRDRLQRLGVRESSYEGPTTIMAVLPAVAAAAGIQTMTVVLQLPAYAQLERDYRGLLAALELLSGLYGLSLKLDNVREQAERQIALMNESAREDTRVQAWISELEALYDSEAGASSPEAPGPQLSPELEGFLRDIERRWSEGEGR